MHGPKGVGALYHRTGLPLASQMTGGGQEFGLRSGTSNVALIAGFARGNFALEFCFSRCAY